MTTPAFFVDLHLGVNNTLSKKNVFLSFLLFVYQVPCADIISNKFDLRHFFFSIIRTRWRKKRISHGTWKTFPVFLHPMEDISSSGSSSGSNDLIWRLTRDSQKNRMIEFRSNGFFQFSFFSYLFHLLQKKVKVKLSVEFKICSGSYFNQYNATKYTK